MAIAASPAARYGLRLPERHHRAEERPRQARPDAGQDDRRGRARRLPATGRKGGLPGGSGRSPARTQSDIATEGMPIPPAASRLIESARTATPRPAAGIGRRFQSGAPKRDRQAPGQPRGSAIGRAGRACTIGLSLPKAQTASQPSPAIRTSQAAPDREPSARLRQEATAASSSSDGPLAARAEHLPEPDRRARPGAASIAKTPGRRPRPPGPCCAGPGSPRSPRGSLWPR